MSASSVSATSFTLDHGATGTVSYSGTTAIFTPATNLAYSTTYTATITTAAKDTAGNALANNYTWSFTTGATPDTTPPTVSSTSPANSATGVLVNAPITATFSEALSASSVSATSFTLDHGATGVVSLNGTTATFTPAANLAYSTTYTATLTAGVKDAAGNALASNYTWSFTTATPPACPAGNGTGVPTTGSAADPGGAFSVSWVACGDSITFTMRAPTSGWISMGLNPAPSSIGADMMTGWVTSAGTTLFDEWSPDYLQPRQDTSSGGTMDLVGVTGTDDGSTTTITFTRKLVTGDTQDQPITSGTSMYLLWATSPNDGVGSTYPKHTLTGVLPVTLLP